MQTINSSIIWPSGADLPINRRHVAWSIHGKIIVAVEASLRLMFLYPTKIICFKMKTIYEFMNSKASANQKNFIYLNILWHKTHMWINSNNYMHIYNPVKRAI